jgi:hypothetical protein
VRLDGEAVAVDATFPVLGEHTRGLRASVKKEIP